MIKSLPRPLLAISALVAVLPLGGCLASTIGSIAASALLSGGPGGPEAPPTVAEQLANTDTRVLDSCRAQIDSPDAPQFVASQSGASQSGASQSGASQSGASQSGASQSGASQSGAPQSRARLSAASQSGAPEPVAGAPSLEPVAATPKPRCSVQPVCLPGHSQPTTMMVCQNAATLAADAAPTDKDRSRRRYDDWDWGHAGAADDRADGAVPPDRSASPAEPADASAG